MEYRRAPQARQERHRADVATSVSLLLWERQCLCCAVCPPRGHNVDCPACQMLLQTKRERSWETAMICNLAPMLSWALTRSSDPAQLHPAASPNCSSSEGPRGRSVLPVQRRAAPREEVLMQRGSLSLPRPPCVNLSEHVHYIAASVASPGR